MLEKDFWFEKFSWRVRYGYLHSKEAEEYVHPSKMNTEEAQNKLNIAFLSQQI
jgi:hypothetical protein